jgi:hypothetical protein
MARTDREGEPMGIEDQVDKLLTTDSPEHKHMVEYVVGQLESGRHLEDIMADENLTSSLSTRDRRRLLEDPRVVGAVRNDVITQMRAQLDAALGQ